MTAPKKTASNDFNGGAAKPSAAEMLKAQKKKESWGRELMRALNQYDNPIYQEIALALVIEGADLTMREKDYPHKGMIVGAARRNWTEVVDAMLERGGLKYEADGPAALIEAINRGNMHMAESLIKAGAKVDGPGHYNNLPLNEAARRDSADFVRLLVAHDVNLNQQDKSFQHTALHIAVMYGKNCGSIGVLLEAGANAELSDEKGNTPLTLAIKYDDLTAMRALIDGGADVNNAAHSPIFTAIESEKLSALRFLLENGADTAVQNSWSKNTPLHVAVEKDKTENLDFVRTLIESGAAVNAINGDGKTVLQKALSQMSGDESPVMMLLVDAGASIDPTGDIVIEALRAKGKDAFADRLEKRAREVIECVSLDHPVVPLQAVRPKQKPSQKPK